MHRLALACLGLLAPLAAQSESPMGTWRAWLESPGGELPFGLDIESSGGALRAFIRNGEERRPVGSATWDGEHVELRLAPYDSLIRARVVAGALDGVWRKRLGADSWSEMVFRAERGASSRFRQAGPPADATPLAPRYEVRFEKDAHPAVGLFEVEADGTARGTFLTALGDYRYLAGDCRGGKLRLSCFDGAHAFLFGAVLDAAGALRGDFWSSASWHETWTAVPDGDAALPDAYRLTRWRGEAGLGDLAFPDLDGEMRRLDDPAFAGKARMLVVFGSWCPNCNDEADYLRELDARYRDKGLSILGLAFERTGDLEVDRAQVKAYADHHELRFPILVAGLADKARASQALPLLDRVRAYPTTVFLAGDGSVHTVHTGFSGPATGEAHKALRREFESVLDELLAAPPGAAPKRARSPERRR